MDKFSYLSIAIKNKQKMSANIKEKKRFMVKEVNGSFGYLTNEANCINSIIPELSAVSNLEIGKGFRFTVAGVAYELNRIENG